MATAPMKYIDNIKIGSDTAQIAAPYIVTNEDKSGEPLTAPLFKNYWETDYTKEYDFTSATTAQWTIAYGDLDKTTPSVTILDSNREIMFAEVKYDKAHNQILITFNEAPVDGGYVLIN